MLLKRFKISEKIAPVEFEKIVYEVMKLCAQNTQFDGTIILTGTNDFPDIITNRFFGVEVKMTIADKWISIGNSILESTRIKDVQKIYILFGKFGGKPDFIFRLYQECLYDIAVTHLPRYKIDMKLVKGSSIFDKMKVDYDTLRLDKNPIKRIKDYYKKQLKLGEELWWIDQEINENELSTPIIKSFNTSFSMKAKNDFRNEAFILFPEIFGKNQAKFERVAAYLFTNYGAVCANMRDNFTAGGKEMIRIDRQKILVPRIYYHLWENAILIKKMIGKIDVNKLKFYWRTDTHEVSTSTARLPIERQASSITLKKDRLTEWLERLDLAGMNNHECKYKLSAIFKSGLHS